MAGVIARIALALLLAPCVVQAQRGSGTVFAGAGYLKTGIDIIGNSFYRNGVRWSPKGVSTIAFIATNAAMAAQGATTSAKQIAARAAYGASLLTVMSSTFGADTVRFQLSQWGLDPQDPGYDPAYAAQAAAGINVALSNGFAVILAMDADTFSGGAANLTMPNTGTARAWQTIGPYFANNRNVLFEVFNEPEEQGGVGQTDWAPAMQPAVTAIRAIPADNILLLDGLGYGRFFAGLSLGAITDALAGRRSFAVHPYFMTGFLISTDWDTAFGNAANNNPMLTSEWGFHSQGCLAGDGTTVSAFFTYVQSKHIGLTFWAVDWIKTLTQDTTSYTPTTMAGFTSCGDGSGTGAGALFAAFTP